MITLWIAAALLAGAAFGLIVLLSARPVLATADAARGVYRRQLTEIDDLADRGLLGEDERKAAHTEAARRLLSEDEVAPEAAPSRSSRLVAITVAALAALGALALYLAAGSAQTPDQPYAARLKEWQQGDPMAMQPQQLAAVIQSALKKRPNDPEGLFFLAQVQVQGDELPSAERNLEKALALQPNRAEGWELLGEVRRALAAGKYPPKVVEPFRKALELNPGSITARYSLAKADISAGRVSEGVAVLRKLKTEAPAEAQEALDREIAKAEGRVVPAMVTADPAIVAMVNGLAARLKDNPDDVAGWQRLIRSYTVLGDQAALNKALTDARAFFKNRPADLATIEAAGSAPAPAPSMGR